MVDTELPLLTGEKVGRVGKALPVLIFFFNFFLFLKSSFLVSP